MSENDEQGCIKGVAPKLRSSKGTIAYHILAGQRGFYFKITANRDSQGREASGTFSKNQCFYIVDQLEKFRTPVETADLFPDRNNNDGGFVTAILKHRQWVERATGEEGTKYQLVPALLCSDDVAGMVANALLTAGENQ